MQYIVEHMLVPGKIENWVPIIDLGSTPTRQDGKK